MPDYRVTVEEDNGGCGSIVGVIVFILILAIVVSCCDGFGGGSSGSSGSSNSSEDIGGFQGDSNNSVVGTTAPDRMKLAKLHVLSDYSDVIDTIKSGSITDNFGKQYDGPYFWLTCSRTTRDAYTELVTNRNYQYLSGTFFADASYDSHQVVFSIYADGELIYESEPISSTTKAIDFNVNIGKAEVVKINATAYNITSHMSSVHLYIVNAEVSK